MSEVIVVTITIKWLTLKILLIGIIRRDYMSDSKTKLAKLSVNKKNYLKHTFAHFTHFTVVEVIQYLDMVTIIIMLSGEGRIYRTVILAEKSQEP